MNHVKKNDLAHGEWTEWLKNVEMDRSDANKFIRIVDELDNGNVGTYPHLGMKALYLIATMPAEERDCEHTTTKGEEKKP